MGAGRTASAIESFCCATASACDHPYTSTRQRHARAGAITHPPTPLQRLTVSLRGSCERRDQCLLFAFTGQLDAYSDKQFTAFVEEHLNGNDLPVVIDLSHIDFLDSSGLGALVQLAKLCSDASNLTDAPTKFQVVGNARVTQTVKLVRLEGFLNLRPDLEQALERLPAA